jgi:hypothetical protein
LVSDNRSQFMRSDLHATFANDGFPLKIIRFPAQGSSSLANLRIPDRAGDYLFTHRRAGFFVASAGLKER